MIEKKRTAIDLAKRRLDRSAVAIADEMDKWNSGAAANFGFITNDGEDYRLFIGGSIEEIRKGLIIGMKTISEYFDSNEERMTFFADLFEAARNIIEIDRDRRLQ